MTYVISRIEARCVVLLLQNEWNRNLTFFGPPPPQVVDFCQQHPDAPLNPTDEQQLEMRTKPLEGWDQDFVRVPLATLFEMILAANFLDLKPMLDVTCKAVAEMIQGKTSDEIKTVFGVEGDFTQEETEQVLRDNPWLEDPAEAEDAALGAAGGGAAAAAADA